MYPLPTPSAVSFKLGRVWLRLIFEQSPNQRWRGYLGTLPIQVLTVEPSLIYDRAKTSDSATNHTREEREHLSQSSLSPHKLTLPKGVFLHSVLIFKGDISINNHPHLVNLHV